MRTFMFLLLLLFVAQQQHLSNAQTLQPIHTCSIVLRGASGFVEGSFSLAEFRLHCWWGDQTGTDTIDATNSSTDAAVKVQLGRNLLVSLKRSGGIPDLSGVQSDWSAAARPFTAISWDDDPYHDPYDNAYRSVMSEDWGLDIVNVPHLQLVDSVVSGIPLSSVGPLLQILNCSTLTTRNVTLEALHRPPGEAAYGAVRVTGLQSATFDGIRCSDVRDALGWACLLLEARPNAAVFIQGSLFVNNSVEFYHGVESSPRPLSNGGQPSTVAELQVAYPSPVYASYDNGVPTSSISEELPLHAVLCTEDDDNSPPFTGYGAILIIYQLDDKSLCNLEHPPGSAEINAIVVLERTVLSYNRGGCGAGISMRSPFAYEAVPECSVNRHVLVILRNSSITSNTADMHGGGIHYRDGWGGTVHLTIDEGSILSLNSAVTQGGGAALQGSHIGNVTISNTTVSYNKANNGGGLFFYAYGNLTTIRVSNSNLSYNNASSSGGAIWAKATTGPIGSILVNDGSILRGNKAVSGNGGAISLSIGGKSTSLKSLVVDGVSILSQNQAGHHGGAIFVEGQGNCSTTTNVLLGGGSELIDNWASGGNGGAMYLSICRLRSLSVVNASISKNMARCFHAFDHCDGDGGGIYAFFQDFPAGGISIREQAVLANNTALRHGGAMYIASQPGGEDSDRFPGNFSLDSSILTGNTAITGNGGAICVDIQADLSAVELSNTILKNNAAVCYDSDVLDGEFPDVLVRTSSGNDSTLNAGCSGGAMYLGMSSMKNPLLITGGSFLVNNSAQRHGGAIFVPERTQHPGLIVSGGSNVSYNMAGARGGAILLQPLLSADWPFQGYTLLFDMNSVASYNRAAYGGFLYMYGTGIDTQLRIDGSDFIGNSAVYDGGAIYMMLAPLDFQPSLNAIVERGSTVALNIAQGQGGAFYLQTHRSLNLTITGASDVSSNWAMSDGGGIYATVTGGGVEGVLVGGSSILSNNTALFGHGGALAIEAAAAINSMLVTDRSRLEDNTAGGSGGAISLNASQLVMPRIAAVTWDGMSTLINNTASMKGGGLYAVSHAVHVSLLGKSEWTDNTAQDGGGAMYIEAFNLPEEASSVRIGGASQLSRNGAKNGGAIYVNGFADIQVGEGSDISLNTAKYDGGAVFLAQLPSEILVQSSSVSNNTAHRGSGGAFYVGTVEPVFLPHATDPSCTLYGDNMNISILNSSFVGNIAGVADGGALYLKPHETCSSETSALLQIDGSIYTQNTALGAGGAIAVRDASNSKVTVSISNSAFKGNTAGTVAGDFTSSANFGGALMIWHEPTDSGGNFTDACHLAVDNTSFQGNSCDGGTGGALMLISCASRFSRCNFTDNHATHSGGAMGALQMARSTATLGLVTTSAFAAVANGAGFSQQAQSMSGQQPRLLLDGDFITQRQNPTQRRIDAIGKDADLSNSRQNGRRKLWDETECSISSESSTRWNVKLEKCIFSQNSADREYGGALYLYMTSGNGQIRIASCSFEKNRAVLQRAGAVFLAARGANASVEVFDSSFNRNAADLSSAGALYALVGQDACATLVNLSMISNQAAVSAGASVLDVRSNGFVRLENSIGGENHAAGGDGGAVLLQLQKDAHAFISNCNFSDNSAAGNGGALLVDANCSSSLLVEKSIMNHNHAGLSGGAIYALYGSKVGQVVSGSAFGSPPTPYTASSCCPDELNVDQHLMLQSVLLVGNTAGQHGGAIFLGSNSALTILNSTMLGNTACEGGGSMSAQNCSSLVLSHSTIQNSSTSGSGGGFWAYGCRRLLLEYVNITGNIARVSGGGLTFSGPTDDIAAEGLTGNTALGGETPQYTSMIVHRARVHDNAAALSSDALEGCQGKDSFQPGEKGKGGGFFITGKVAGVLSLVNLEQPNYASLGSAIASTQRCKQASLSNAASNGLVGTDDVRVRNWDESWALLDSLATANCWLLQLGDTLLPSVTLDAEGMTQPSPQQKHTIWMEDFLASALQVSCNGKWEILESLYDAGEDEAAGHYDDDVPLLVKTFLADSITQRANDNPDFIAGQVLTMATPDGKLPGAAAVAAGLSQKWFDQLLSQLSSCMRNQQPTSDKQHSAMRQQSYLALPAAYMGLRLLDTDLVYSQRLQLQPGFAVNLTAQLYDMSGQAVTWDMAPSTITLVLRPRSASNAFYNQTAADGSVPWLDNDVANLDPGLNKSLTVSVVNGSATWEGVKTLAWPGYYSLILLLTTNDSSFVKVAPLEMEVEVLPCGVGQTLDLSHSSYKTSWTGCRACPPQEYGLWQDDRPWLTAIIPSSVDADAAAAADSSSSLIPYFKSMNITLRAQNSACMLCPANALCLGGAVIVPAPGYWHSAANSTKIHTCPNPSACNVDGDKRTFPEWIYSMVGARDYRTGLLSWCQLAWYSSVVPGAAVLSAQMPGPPPEVTGDGLQPLEVLANNTAVLLTNIIALRRQNDTAPDISLPRCLVSGLPSGHLDSYMQQQCAEGYTGNLCAACIEGYYVDTDFNCKRCPSVARTVGLGLISFFGSVALILFTTITNFSDGFGEKTNGQQHANVLPGKGGDRVEIGDVVKVIVLHLQYLIIVTRLSVNYPSIILRCQAVFSAITGAENYLVYSPSCLLPDSDSAGQAFIQWLAGILTPCAVATVSMLLWALRYAYPLREALAKAFVKGARSAWATLAGIPKSLAVWKGRQLPSSRLGTDSVCGDEDMSVCSGQRADSIGPCPPPLAPLDTSLVTQDSHIGLRTVFRDVQIVALDAADPSAGVSTGVRVPSLAYSASGSTDALASGLPTAASAAPVVDLNGVELGPAAKVIESTSCGGNEKKSGLQPSPTCDVITNAEDQSDSTSDAPGILRADDAVSPSGPPLLRGGHSINILSGGTCIETAPTEVLSGINSGYGTSYYYRHPYEMWNRKPAKTLSSMGSAAISDAIRTLHKLRTLAVHTQQSSQATFLQVDKAMSLVEQLGVVLMAAVFILYPSWANAALSTFACYPIDDGEGSFPETQQATWRYGYWVRNMQAMCYSGDHLHVYVPIGVVAVVVFCVLPPLVSFIFVWRVRGRLEDAHVRKVYGFLYKRYKPRFIWWETVLELETLILVSVEVLGRGLIVSYQALLLLAAFTVIALINVSCAPLLSRLLVIMEFMSLGTLSLTITLSLYFTVDDELNPVAENALAILIIVLNTSLMLFFLYIASRHFWPSAVKKVAPRAQAVVRKLSSIGSNVSRQKDADMDGRGSEGDGQRVVRWPILCRLTAWWRGSPAAAPFGRRNPPNGDTLARTLDHSSDGCDDNGALVTSPGSGSRLASPHKNGVGLARVSVCLEEHLSNVSAVRVLKPSTSSHVCIQLDEAR